jgi:ABC-type Fe3+-hydroxamate transport system substrate-binding protein
MCILCGCRAIGAPEETTISVTVPETTVAQFPAQVGNITLSENAERVVSLSPAVVEIICELGAEARLVGVGQYCDYPESVKTLPVCGSAANPDFAAIKALEPDLLITQSPIAKKDVTLLNNSGIEVLILQSPKTIDEFYAEYEDIAKALYGNTLYEEKAETAILPIKEAFSGINNNFGDYILYVTENYDTAPDSIFAAEILNNFGENIGGGKVIPSFMTEKDEDGNRVTPENEILRSGTVIYLPEYLESLADSDNDGVSDFEDAAEVIVIPETLFMQTERPSGRIVGLIEFLEGA